MDGRLDATAGAPLAAHFEAKRRILSTVKEMQARGETLQEATPEEVFEAADKAAESVFRFDFHVSDAKDVDATDAKKRRRNRKKHKKRKGQKAIGDQDAESESESRTSSRSTDAVTPAPRNEQQKLPAASFLKLRKATGTESEVAKMHLRYGQGRRNMTAIKQRELRKKADEHHDDVATSAFRFNFATS